MLKPCPRCVPPGMSIKDAVRSPWDPRSCVYCSGHRFIVHRTAKSLIGQIFEDVRAARYKATIGKRIGTGVIPFS